MDLIDITSMDTNIAYVSKIDQYGGKRYEITFTPEVKEMLDWYKNHKQQVALEQKARVQFPSVASAYEQYQTTLKLVLDQI